jgi:hypothetical protein
MSAPSRNSELRRRRARHEKVSLLRKRYASASESDRNRILAKLKKVAPTMTAEQFTKAASPAAK